MCFITVTMFCNNVFVICNGDGGAGENRERKTKAEVVG